MAVVDTGGDVDHVVTGVPVDQVRRWWVVNHC